MFKMPNALSLNVGSFFAESNSQQTWFLNKKTLVSYVSEYLETLGDPEQNFLVRYFVQHQPKFISRVDFDQIALLVTAGFESLLEINQSQAAHAFSRKVNLPPTANLIDTTFGINERVNANGLVLKRVETSDLEFIASKLELLSIKTIAIGFLHSKKNPENEKFVADFFEKKSFRVFCSANSRDSIDETERWQQALFNAHAAARESKIASELESLKSQFKNLKLEASHEPVRPTNHFEANLHLGLESFFLHDSQSSTNLEISATTKITSGFYNIPDFSDEMTGFDPGPMLMGKSFVPTLIDLLFVTGSLVDLEAFGVSSKAAERAKPRILESILTLIRNNQERKHIDMPKELSNLEKILGYRIWSEMLKYSSFKRLRLSGPLATASMLKLIKQWRPRDIEVSLND